MMNSRSAPRFGLWLAFAAITVNAPRLVLAFLEADGIEISPSWRAALLGLTGIATGTVLTGGGAYLAHAVRRPGEHRRLLAATWLLVLSCAAVLVTPVLVAGLAGDELQSVLASAPLRWTWSGIAVVGVELVAAGAMVAHAAESREIRSLEQLELDLLELARERDRLAAQLRESSKSPAVKPRRPRKRLSYSGDPVPCRNGCGFVGASPMAERGHQRTCTRREHPARAEQLAAELLPRADHPLNPSAPRARNPREDA